jgi:hypothetical protein
MKQLASMLKIILICLIAFPALLITFQRKMLFQPGHGLATNGLAPWIMDGRIIGYARTVDHPRNVWLFTHGNAGQAADRDYALHCFSDTDSVFILEYPGYGRRAGSPGRASFDSAAKDAYLGLRQTYPNIPVCSIGESIGSGPASSLSRLEHPPDKIVLVVPFDNLAAVVRDHFPFIPAGLVLFDRWDNVEALKEYTGKVEIYGAADDRVIAVQHARNLANALSRAVFHETPGGHNDWSQGAAVKIRN